MRNLTGGLLLALSCAAGSGLSAAAENLWTHEPSLLFPFGTPNPAQTDPGARIFDPMIGMHDCQHVRTDIATGRQTRADAVWTWRYDMNGYGIRDDYRYGKGAPVSQRIYDPATGLWHVWYFLGQDFYYAGEWVGGRRGDRLVFDKHGEVVGGKTYLNRLEYYDIEANAFKWRSTMIDEDTGEAVVDWEIGCERRAS